MRSYRRLGAQIAQEKNKTGVRFSVWAPNARRVSVLGEFNDWKDQDQLQSTGDSGVWSGFISKAKKGDHYKYFIESNEKGYRVQKADPYAIRAEVSPKSASTVWDLQFDWSDQAWMSERGAKQNQSQPMSVYEVHLGSWRRDPNEPARFLNYRELAGVLPAYVREQGFTHVELMPIMEHPFYGSWGYQVTGYFAPTSRYGTPQDFMYLINAFHREGLGVILDWVPSHFPTDEHGLGFFDGTHLYEHADPRRGFHPDWNTNVFNVGRDEVKAFLIENALYWLEMYHIDGLRVDAVASMLYLDYSRKAGEWIPNAFGGREDLEAIRFLKELNETVYREFPDVHVIAEESTAWPMVSRPTYLGGLGFGMKWDMGWMHDTLKYFCEDPVHRKYHHGQLAFRMIYAFNENFLLPISHDEVVYGKRSLLDKMPGDIWQKFANLRSFFGYMYAQPGKKLLFMGCEFGQWREWNHDQSLDWHLLEDFRHQGVQRLVRDLNNLYRNERALHQGDFAHEGFEWLDLYDSEQSTLSFFRKNHDGGEIILAVYNFTPVPRERFRLGVPYGGKWRPILQTDAREYGGTGEFVCEDLWTNENPSHGRRYSIELRLPPLAVLYLKWEG